MAYLSLKSFAVMHMPQLLMLFKTLPYSIFWVWLKVLANSGAPISCNKPWYIALYNSNWNRHAGTGNNKNSHHCERPKSRSKHEGFRFASGLAVNVYTSQKKLGKSVLQCTHWYLDVDAVQIPGFELATNAIDWSQKVHVHPPLAFI